MTEIEIQALIAEYLKNNLGILISCEENNYGGSVTVKVDLFLGQEKIDTTSDYFNLDH